MNRVADEKNDRRITAISYIRVYESKLASSGVEKHLLTIAGALRKMAGCLAYDVARCKHESGVWLVTGHWSSFEAMEAHFDDPALNRFSAMMSTQAVKRPESGGGS